MSRWNAHRRSRDRLTRLRAEPLEPRLMLAVFTVNDPGDEPDLIAGDGMCKGGEFNDDGDPVYNDICSFKGALSEAKSDPGMDTIKFGIPGPIFSSTLFSIGFPVILDGTTAGPGKMELIGSGSGTGLYLGPASGGSTIRGMVIHGFGSAIRIDSDGNTIAGNYIGTNFAGTAAPGNSVNGVFVFKGAGNTIGGDTPADRNVISGNGTGVFIFNSAGTGTTFGNIVRGN
jgi:hypothetical protein